MKRMQMRIISRVKDELKKGHSIIIIIGFLYIVPNKESGRKISIVCAFLMSFIFFSLFLCIFLTWYSVYGLRLVTVKVVVLSGDCCSCCCCSWIWDDVEDAGEDCDIGIVSHWLVRGNTRLWTEYTKYGRGRALPSQLNRRELLFNESEMSVGGSGTPINPFHNEHTKANNHIVK